MWFRRRASDACIWSMCLQGQRTSLTNQTRVDFQLLKLMGQYDMDTETASPKWVHRAFRRRFPAARVPAYKTMKVWKIQAHNKMWIRAVQDGVLVFVSQRLTLYGNAWREGHANQQDDWNDSSAVAAGALCHAAVLWLQLPGSWLLRKPAMVLDSLFPATTSCCSNCTQSTDTNPVHAQGVQESF